MAEKHYHKQHKGVHCKGLRNVSQLASTSVPAEEIGTAEEGYRNDKRTEPVRVKKLLHLVPIPVNQIAKEEELEELKNRTDIMTCRLVKGVLTVE